MGSEASNEDVLDRTINEELALEHRGVFEHRKEHEVAVRPRINERTDPGQSMRLGSPTVEEMASSMTTCRPDQLHGHRYRVDSMRMRNQYGLPRGNQLFSNATRCMRTLRC